MNALATLQMLLLAALGFALLAGVGCSLLVGPVMRWTAHWAPARRHRALGILAAAPWALATSAVLSVMLPSILGQYWPAQNHCHEHGAHSHLCFSHPAPGHGGWLGWALVAAAVIYSGQRILGSVLSLVRGTRVVRELSKHAYRDGERDAWIVPSAAEFCVSVGLARPRLLASRRLLSAASDVELMIILEHERAHAKRRDNLCRLVARAASALLLPSPRRRLLDALELAAERACDEVAALRTGDRLRVAETLLAFEKRLQATQLNCSPLIANFGASSVPQRVEAMLEPPRTAGACSLLLAMLAGAAIGLLAMHDALHHATESLLALLS